MHLHPRVGARPGFWPQSSSGATGKATTPRQIACGRACCRRRCFILVDATRPK